MKPLVPSASLLFVLLLSAGADDSWQLVAERAALSALQSAFHSPLLNATWTGLQCFFNQSTWFGVRCINNRVVSLSLEGIGLSGRLDDPRVLSLLTELTVLSFKNNSVAGGMLDFSANPKLSAIDLSMNKFTGPISPSLLHLHVLQSLQLYSNEFNGSIPPLNQTTLKAFNVSHNNLTGEIPQTTALQRFPPSSYAGNPGLCGEPAPTGCPEIHLPLGGDSNKAPKVLNKSPFIAAVVSLDTLVLGLLLWSMYACWKKGRARRETKAKPVEGDKTEAAAVREEEEERKVTFLACDGEDVFELDDLLKVSAEGLGKGGFATCYKAKLNLHRAIVVKRLRDLRPLTREEFETNIRALGDIRHPNLLPLLGYHYAKDEKLMFYNFARQGNLYDRIHGARGAGRIPFKWASRLAVAKGVAVAMACLHENAKAHNSPVPHGNLKCSNVLMDRDGVPLVSDYGLLPLVSAPLAAQRMVVYRSPEYQHGRVVSRKSDVWSYGCLLLELLTGRVSVHTAKESSDGVELYNWVHRAIREEWTFEVFDAEVTGQRGVVREMVRLLEVAMRCCERFPEKRPEMGEVVREVEAMRHYELEPELEEEEDESL